MPVLRERTSGRSPVNDEDARRRHTVPAVPIPGPASAVLVLQRAAGNHAVAQLLATSPIVQRNGGSLFTRTLGWSRGTPVTVPLYGAEIAILVLQMMLRGETPRAEAFSPRVATKVAMAMQDILHYDKAVLYWQRKGCVEVDSDGMSIVRPAPAHAVAGFLELAPRDPRFLPTVPESIPEGKTGSVEDILEQTTPAQTATSAPGPSTRSAGPGPATTPLPRHPELRSTRAVEVATYMIANKTQRQPYLARGLRDPKDHAIGFKVLTHLVSHLGAVVSMIEYGMEIPQSDGTKGWVRPGPAHLIASRLGIGPDIES